ncbi:hypothetical protein K0M31_004026 [Melipona bicolor]|uniref:Uncharacterized protein n=1 Tax=Melipona bicolor TaxID=60889 RepID=A0AA40FZ05_9HYME|nr:hypothetical protein K0M31_004026 [Melipona bicolor]
MRRTWNHSDSRKKRSCDPGDYRRKGGRRGWRCAARDGIMAQRARVEIPSGIRGWSGAENSARQIATDNYRQCRTGISRYAGRWPPDRMTNF